MAAAAPHRAVVHIDVDAMYAQCEQLRLGLPADTPLAVQQWTGLIAVSYAARARGVTRHMRVHEAKKLCPELVCVHVQTIPAPPPPAADGGGGGGGGDDDAVAAAGPSAAAEAAAAGPPSHQQQHQQQQHHHHHAVAPAADVEGSARDRGSAKACLQRYRRASAAIMAALQELAGPGAPFEKASIDEAAIDVTALAARELEAAEAADGQAGVDRLVRRAYQSSVVLDGGRPLSSDAALDRLAAAAAAVAARLRDGLKERTGFTVSAGVAPNRLLAKVGAGMHKPARQTLVVAPRAVPGLMAALPLGRVRGWGGKLGDQLAALGARCAGDVASWPADRLARELNLDPRVAAQVVDAANGRDDSPVEPKALPKSLNSCKSFGATSDAAEAARWLRVLAAELAERMAEDEADHGRRARTLVLFYRTTGRTGGGGRGAAAPERSVRGAMPTFVPRDAPCERAIAAAAVALLRGAGAAPWPVNRLALAASDFVPTRAPESGALLRFFKAAGPPAPPGNAGPAVAAGSSGARPSASPSPSPSPAKAAAAAGAAGAGCGGAQRGPLDAFLRPPPPASPPQQPQGQEQEQELETAAAQQQLKHAAAAALPPSLSPPPPSPLSCEHGTPAAADAGASTRADDGATTGGGDATAAADANAAALAGVDLAEQRRILRDIEQRAAADKRRAQAATAAAQAGGGGGQKRKKQQPPGGGKGEGGGGKRQLCIDALFGGGGKRP